MMRIARTVIEAERGGVSAVMSGKADRATFLKPFDEAIDSRFQAAA